MFVCLFVCYLADSLLLTLASRNTQTLCSWNISPKKRLPRTKLWRKTAFALEPIHLEKSSSRINIHKWEREKITRAVSSKRGRVVKWSQGKWKNCDSEGTERGGGKRRRDRAERRFRRERGGGGLQGDWELFLPSVGLQTLMCKCVCFGNFQE